MFGDGLSAGRAAEEEAVAGAGESVLGLVARAEEAGEDAQGEVPP